MRNFSKHIFFSAIIISFAVTIITVLVALSHSTHKEGRGFKRKFLTEKLRLSKSSRLPETVRSIAGYVNHKLYFETDSAGIILVANSLLDSFAFIRFAIPQNDQINSLFNTTLDSFSLRIALGNIAAIYIFYSSKVNNIISIKNKFTRCVQISPGSFVLRSFKKRGYKWNQEFIKQYVTGDSIKEETNISDITDDAGISTDGLLHYDKYTNLLLYVSYYSNNIICFDTNLNVTYKAHTIDTFTSSRLKTIAIEPNKTGQITNDVPVEDVNLFSYVHNGILYVNSFVISDNEKRSDFYNTSVIDVYQISNGSYKRSFYLPKYEGERAREFIITGDQLVALYKNYVVGYEMIN